MALEVVRAFTLEHVRWLAPLEEYALREVKGAAVEGREPKPEARGIYDPLTEDIRNGNCWILCNCLPHEPERPVIVPARRTRGISLGNLPDAPVPHDGSCVFRLRGHSIDTSGYLFNPLTYDRQGAASLERDRRREPRGRGGPVGPGRGPRAQVLHPGGAAAHVGRRGAVSVSGGLGSPNSRAPRPRSPLRRIFRRRRCC